MVIMIALSSLTIIIYPTYVGKKKKNWHQVNSANGTTDSTYQVLRISNSVKERATRKDFLCMFT